MKRLAVDARPCSSCPYRRDTPPGVWDPEEYAKLPRYDDNTEVSAVFVCHQPAKDRATVCRGWLTVARESVAARLAVLGGAVTDDERYAEVDVPLYDSGLEAAAAGVAGCKNPSPEAQRVIDRIVRKQARHAARG